MNHPLRPSPHPTSTPGTQSRACANCARAKAKCISNLGGAKCGRCDRLKKECQPAIPIRKPKTAKKPATNSTARLEEKLDGLFSLLKSGTQPSAQASAQPAVHLSTEPTITPASTQLETPEDSHSEDTSGANAGATRVAEASHLSGHHSFCSEFSVGAFRNEFPACFDARNGRLFEVAYEKDVGVDPPANFFRARRSALPSSASTAYHTPNDTTSSYPYPSPDDANALLSFFASRMLPYFPCIEMPPYSNSLDFRIEHPFLFLCIIAVASKSTEQQAALGKEIRWIVGRKMMVESERTLDLLQGLLVYSGWSQTHIYKNPIVTNLVQLAIGLLGDLGLKRAPAKQAPNGILSYDARDFPKPFIAPKRTIEEQRVAVGVFYISSVYEIVQLEPKVMLTALRLSVHFQRIEPLRWTPYLDDCLQVLTEAKDAPTEIDFVQRIRLQLLTKEALSLNSHDDVGEARSPDPLPTGFYRKSLLTQLETIKRDIPLELQQNEALLMQLYIAELSIHEIALSSTPPTSSAPNFEQAEAVFACLRAAKDWFDIFLRTPPALLVDFSMMIFAQLAHCIITLYRLSTFEAAGWDQRLARDIVDFSAILGEVVKMMKQVKEAAGLDMGIEESLDVYGLTSHRFQTVKEWWDAKIALEAAPLTLNDGAKDEMYTECVDDLWLKDILGMGWEEYQMEYMQTL